jgi:Fe-S-cluster containining protein
MTLEPDDSRPSKTYFFDQGLRFACQRCGRCCIGESGSIYMGFEEINRIARHLDISVERFLRVYAYPFKDSYSIREDTEGRCLFFKEGCGIYKVRPLQCRAFPFWFDNIRSEQRWHAVRAQCPGIGRGRLFAFGQILEWAFKTMHI